MWDVLAVLVVVAIVLVLVRPSSPAVEVVKALGDLVVAITRQALDLPNATQGG